MRYEAVRGLRGAIALQAAAKRVVAGGIETVLILSRTALYHRVFFNADGVWVQQGGLFGRADRDEPLFRLTSVARRKAYEQARVALIRG